MVSLVRYRPSRHQAVIGFIDELLSIITFKSLQLLHLQDTGLYLLLALNRVQHTYESILPAYVSSDMALFLQSGPNFHLA